MRTYERRRAARERAVRGRFPRLGGLVLALSQEPATTVDFARGAKAEIRVAQYLMRRCGSDVELLFNRRLGARGRSGDIDVLAVAPSGVHIIDVKHYQGAEVRVRRSGGLGRSMRERLIIRGRDHTRLLDSLARQEHAVRSLLDRLPGGPAVPLHTAMCFVDSDLPWLPERVHGVALLGCKGNGGPSTSSSPPPPARAAPSRCPTAASRARGISRPSPESGSRRGGRW